MNTLRDLLPSFAERLGWAVIHSLWQGAAVAILLAVGLRVFRHSSAAARHAMCLLSLVGLLASSTFTAFRLSASAPKAPPGWSPVERLAGESSIPPAIPLSEPIDETAGSVKFGEALPATSLAAAPSLPWSDRLKPWTPGIAATWFAGVLLLSLRHLGGWRTIRAWRRNGQAVGEEFDTLFTRLAERFGLAGKVWLRQSSEAFAPMLTGVLRPIVLFPAQLLTGLTLREVEAILAHELAHLARRDTWTNLAQVVIEIVLFYHPAVWWMSRRARSEREHAADDLALHYCQDRRGYAEALARLAELQSAPSFSLAATGGSLLARIRRIVLPPPREPATGLWTLPLLSVVLALAAAFLFHASAEISTTVLVKAGESLQAAIDAAPAGAVLKLAEGEWKERISISKPLTLEGAGWEKTTLRVEQPPRDEYTKAAEALAPRLKSATGQDRERLLLEFNQTVVRPAILVHGGGAVHLRGLRIQGFTAQGYTGSTSADALVVFHHSPGTIADCVVAGPYMNGVVVSAGAEVEIHGTLVAALWGTGVAVYGKDGEGGVPGKLLLTDSEVRNCNHRCVTIGPDCNSTVISKNRISGSAWHGIRYDDASPTITGNVIFGHARSGIYASGKTAATIRGNVFWRNEMDGISCWFANADTIENNIFSGNLREGLAVLRSAKPTIRQNVFSGQPVAVSIESAAVVPVLNGNLFWNNETALEVASVKKPAPDGSLTGEPKFRGAAQGDFALEPASAALSAQVGALDPLPASGKWALLAEEKAIIPAGETRDFRSWSAPGSSKPAPPTAPLSAKLQADSKKWIADAFQLDDAAKREAAIASIRAAIENSDPASIRAGLEGFQSVTPVAFDKLSFRPAFRRLLKHERAEIRTAACRALGNTGISEEDVALVAPLVADESFEVQVAAAGALMGLSGRDFTGLAGAAILKLLDKNDPKLNENLWGVMWGTKVSPEIEQRIVDASRKEDQGTGYSNAFYYALTVHQSKREPTVTRLIELIASRDPTNVGGRCLWGLLQGVEKDQQPRVAEVALKVLNAREDGYMRRQAFACLRAYGTEREAEGLRTFTARPGVTGALREEAEKTLQEIASRK